jgi:GNAT superfamily N-acetyltransferase
VEALPKDPTKPKLPLAHQVKLRRATVKDLEVLVKQRRGMWRDMGGNTQDELDDSDRVFRTWARSQLKHGMLIGWLAQTGRKSIVAGGTIWLRPTVPRPGYKHQTQPFLLSMYTEPEWRGRGLASLIVTEAVKWSKKNEYKEILLHASHMGKGVYLHQGFSRTWEMKLRL